MKYVFFAMECYPYPLAKHLIDEGHEVIIGIVESIKELDIPGMKNEESAEQKHKRLSTYNGIVQKHRVDEVLKLLWRVPKNERDDYFIFFDYNNMYNIADKVLRMGFKNGLFPTKYYYRMEKERELAKDFVKKNYPDVVVADSFNFKAVKDGIDFINDSEEKVYVLKSNGNFGKTIVPRSDDVKKGKRQIIEALTKGKSEYEMGGFLLEEKIKNCQEVTPVMVFYNGKPIYSLVEFESKEFGAGNIGHQKGGNLALSVRTDFEDKINKISFPKVVYDLAKKQPGLAVFDIGLLWNGENFYFTEFCAMRYGWDGIFSEIVMRDDGFPFVNAYFDDICRGINPLRNKFGASIRMFNLNGNYDNCFESEDNLTIDYDKQTENNLFLYQVKNKGSMLTTAGSYDFIGVATGGSDVLETAVSKAYAVVEGIDFEKLYYRPKFDFLSMDYKSSILNRLAAIRPFMDKSSEN